MDNYLSEGDHNCENITGDEHHNIEFKPGLDNVGKYECLAFVKTEVMEEPDSSSSKVGSEQMTEKLDELKSEVTCDNMYKFNVAPSVKCDDIKQEFDRVDGVKKNMILYSPSADVNFGAKMGLNEYTSEKNTIDYDSHIDLMEHFIFRYNTETELQQIDLNKNNTEKRDSSATKVKARHKKDDKVYTCHVCGYRTNHRYDVNRHLKLKHFEGAKWYHCHLCDYKTTRKGHVKQHFTLKHDEKAEFLQCHSCDYKTKTNRYLLDHIRRIHTNKVKVLQCQFCDYTTIYMKRLSAHFSTKHDDTADYQQCQYCEYKTKSHYYLTDHVRRKHVKTATLFQCNFCDYEAKNKQLLMRHFTVKHDETAELIRCDSCDYVTRSKHYFSSHLRNSHLNNVLLECQFCDFTTKHRGNLNKHVKKLHDEQDQKPCGITSIVSAV